MPLILIIGAVVIALLLGGFMFISKPSDTTIEVATPVARVEETVPVNTETATDTNTDTIATTGTAPVTETPAPFKAETAVYKNGEYTVTSSYIAPSRTTHNVTATFTLTNDVVTKSTVAFTGEENTTSAFMQSKFSAAYQTQVVGEKLDAISLTRVGGASLTTGAFNKAIAEIKTEAKS